MTAIDPKLAARLVPFKALPGALRESALDQARVETLEVGVALFHEGDHDRDLIYLIDGVVRLSSDNRPGKTIKGGTPSARHPLSPNVPREHTARVEEPAKVLRIERALLDTCLIWAQTTDAGEPSEDPTWIARMSCSGLFARIPAPNVRKIFRLMQQVHVKAGDTIIRQGEEGDYYYVIEQGRCVVTRRLPGHKEDIRLAERVPGESFGEEALISQSRRNATIRMLTDGVLRRLTKRDFIELIHKPTLRSVSREVADRMARSGATWIDVRLSDENRKTGIKGSLNIPLADIRSRVGDLDRDKAYIVYCDTGRRSSAGAFLLSDHGLDAYHLRGGLFGANREPAVEMAEGLGSGKAMRITRELAEARRQVEEALQRMAETEAALQATEAESFRIKSSGAAQDPQALQQIEQRLAEDRRKYAAEARRTEKALRKAHRTRIHLEAEKRTAELEASRLHSAQEEIQIRQREEAEARLKDGETRLQREYSRASEALEELQHIRANTESGLDEEQRRLESELHEADDYLQQLDRAREEALKARQHAKSRLADFQDGAAAKRAELGEREDTLRQQAEERLRQERTTLEAEFMYTLELLETARVQREQARQAHQAAEAETERVAEEVREDQERMRREAEARIQAERERLSDVASGIRSKLATARQAKQRAEQARKALEAELARQAGRDERPEIDARIDRHREAAARAERDIEDARSAQMNLEVAQHIMEETQNGRGAVEEALRNQLERELDEWVHEDEARSSEQAEATQEVRGRLHRAEERVEAEKTAEQQATFEMLDEIHAQLGKGKPD